MVDIITCKKDESRIFLRFGCNCQNPVLKSKLLSTSVSFDSGSEPVQQVTEPVLESHKVQIRRFVLLTCDHKSVCLSVQ